MLLETEKVLPLLRCPKTGNKLKKVDNKLIADCEEGYEYEIKEGYPVLIDFENSVLDSNSFSLSSSIDRDRPGLLGVIKKIVSPENPITNTNFESLLSRLVKDNPKPRVLIIGGGTIGYGMDTFYENPDVEIVAFDIYGSPNVQFLADGHSIPLEDSCFDAVIIQAVLEHVLMPDKVVSEIHRILNEDGVVYSETPFMQQVHEAAYDFTRYTESGHRYLFRNFELIDSGTTAGAGTQLLWAIDYFFGALSRSRKMGKVAKLFFFWVQYFDQLIPSQYNIDSASGVYFLGKKSETELQPKEVITYYQGAQ